MIFILLNLDFVNKNDIEIIDGYLYSNLRPIDYWRIQPPRAIISRLKSTSAAAVLSLANNNALEGGGVNNNLNANDINNSNLNNNAPNNKLSMMNHKQIITSTQNVLSSGGAALAITSSSNAGNEKKEEEMNKSLKNVLVLKTISKELIIASNITTNCVHIFHKSDLSISIELYANPVNNNLLTAASCFPNMNRIVNLGFSDGTIISYIIRLI